MSSALSAGLSQVASASGITAYVALFLALVCGLCVPSGFADGWLSRQRCLELHRTLSAKSLLLTGVHVAALLARAGGWPRAARLLAPMFFSWSEPVLLFGALAAQILLVIELSSHFRRRTPPVLWRALHALALPGFVLVTVHGLIASDGRRWAVVLYTCALATILVLAALRWLAAANRAPRVSQLGADTRARSGASQLDGSPS